MRNDLQEAVRLVRDHGRTYQQAADAIGLTRAQVAGACNRAGFISGRPTGPRTPEGIKRISATSTAHCKRWWRKASKEQQAKRIAALHAGRARYWRKVREQRITKAQQILEVYDGLKSCKEVAAIVGTTHSYVRTVARQRFDRSQSEHDRRYLASPLGITTKRRLSLDWWHRVGKFRRAPNRKTASSKQ